MACASTSPDCINDGVAQFVQAAVKEMPDSGHDKKLRPRFQAIHPVDHALRIDHLVGGALHDQPWTLGRLNSRKIESPHRRCDRNQRGCRPPLQQTQGNVSTKGKSGNHQLAAWPARGAPGGDRVSVRSFAVSVIEHAAASSYAPEVEPYDRNTRFQKRATQCRYDLVFHGATEQGMRMAHDGIAATFRPGLLRNRFDLAGRTVDRHALHGRRSRHSMATRSTSKINVAP